MKSYDCRFRLSASHGGGERTVSVEALDKVDAMVKAFLILDDLGIDRWALLSCNEATS